MASTRATPPAPEVPTEVGTFISTTPIGFVVPTDAEVRAIMRAVQTPEIPEGDLFYRDLLIIKQLAPEQSRGLLVYPAPMVRTFVSQFKDQLVLKYYLLGGSQ